MTYAPRSGWHWGDSKMIKIYINLSSRPFVNNRKFYLLAGSLLIVFLVSSYWNFSRYHMIHAHRGEANRLLSGDRVRIEAMTREQEKLLSRLQTADTAEFLDRVEHVNQLITRRTFSWTALLNDLETLTPANLQIVSIKPQVRGKEMGIEIIANGRESGDYIKFISNLEASEKFFDVSPLYEDLSKRPGFVGREIGVIVKYRGQG